MKSDYLENVILSALEDKDATIEELSDATGIEQWRIEWIISVDLVHLTMGDAIRIAKALNINPYDLYIGALERKMKRKVESSDIDHVEEL